MNSKVISFYSSKGGVGKTTSCIILAQVLAERGARVHIIDADPNLPLDDWYDRRGGVAPFSVSKCLDDKRIAFEIKAAKGKNDYVLIDLEGTRNTKSSYAIAKSDLVVIPFQRSNLDAKQAAEAIDYISLQSDMLERQIDYLLCMTKTSPSLRTKTLKETRENLETNRINLAGVELYEREPFKNIFDFKKTLYELKGKGRDEKSLGNALVNAEDFTNEILSFLESSDLQEVA